LKCTSGPLRRFAGMLRLARAAGAFHNQNERGRFPSCVAHHWPVGESRGAFLTCDAMINRMPQRRARPAASVLWALPLRVTDPRRFLFVNLMASPLNMAL
jgi:hypothetical protein